MKSKLITACEKFDSTAQVNSYLSNVLSHCCPIIEEIPNDNENKLVLFIYEEGNLHSVSLYSPLIGNFPKKMKKLYDSDYFYYSIIVPTNIRVTYAFIEDDSIDYDRVQTKEESLSLFIKMWSLLKSDKYNPNQITLKTGNPRSTVNLSILEMPLAPPLDWSEERKGVANGSLQTFKINSIHLRSTRDYWVYLPDGYTDNTSYPLLIVFDGQFYHESGIPLPTILDNLIGKKMIPPIIAVLIDSVGFDVRAKDFRSEIFSDFIIHEMLPEITSKYSISNNCYDKILMGASLGGYFSLYLSIKHSDIFGSIISQSDGDEAIIPLIQQSNRPLNIYLDMGTIEKSTILDQIHQLLLSSGNSVIYRIIPGAHDLVTWETAIPDALIEILKFNKRGE